MITALLVINTALVLYLLGIHHRDEAVARAVLLTNEPISRKRTAVIQALVASTIIVQAVLMSAVYWSQDILINIGSTETLYSPEDVAAIANVGFSAIVLAVAFSIVSTLLIGRLIANGTRALEGILSENKAPDFVPDDIIMETVAEKPEQVPATA